MPKIAEIKEIDGEVWVRVGVAGEFASGLAIMSPEEIAAKEREYSKAYDHGKADAIKNMEERDSERESVALTKSEGFTKGAAHPCNCHKCTEAMHKERPATIPIRMMILCSKCGNKRCPHATDHELDCTGSNDPGQKGSVYE